MTPSDPESTPPVFSQSDCAVSQNEAVLVELLDRYVADLESGVALSIKDFVEQHAKNDQTLRKELVACLEGVTVVHAAVESARGRQLDDPGQSRLTAVFPVGGDPATITEGQNAAPEQQQIGDYRLVREIGRGGMGVVYEAEEHSLSRRVALKVLPFAAVLDQRQITRFRNEAQAAAGLHHANIVPVFAIGQERGVHFYAMQYIEGQSLGQAITELRRESAVPASPDATTASAPCLAEITSLRTGSEAPGYEATATGTLGPTHRSGSFFRAAARLMADSADALQHAHDFGIVHRDVKPSNLLIDQQGKVWVADFGLARMQTDLGVTATGDVVGTLRYMSPEQARGRADQVDGRTDVYALGATLYELLTLRHAHPGENRRQLLDDLERVEPQRPRRINPSIPADLENIVLRAMEKDRGARYASAAELRDDLRRFLDGKATVARPATLFERAGKWARRHQQAVAAGVAVLALISVVATVSGLMVNAARGRAEAALAQAESHRSRSDRLLDQARHVLDRFGGDLSDQLAATPNLEPIRVRALEDTLAYYRYFLEESDGDPRWASSAAQTRIRAAAVSERLGKREQALALYHAASESLEEILSETPGDTEATYWLARCLTNQGLLLGQLGDQRTAGTAIDRAVGLRRDLLNDLPQDAGRLSDLAAALSDRAGLTTDQPAVAGRDLNEAVGLLRRAQRIARDDPGPTRRLAIAQNALASLTRRDDPAAAAPANDAAIELLKSLVASDPEIDAYRDDLAIAYSNRGALAADAGRWLAAAEAYGSAAGELERLAERAPLIPRRRSERAVALAQQGLALARAHKPAFSDTAFDTAEETLQGLIDSYPTADRYKKSLAALINNRGVVLRDSGRLDESAIAFARSVRLEERRIADTNPAKRDTLLAVHYANHAQVLGKLGRFEEAARVETKRQALVDRIGSQSEEATP